MRHPVALVLVVLVLASVPSTNARAGDPPAHRKIAIKACTVVQNGGNPLTDGNNFPAANSCGPWAAMPDDWASNYQIPRDNTVNIYTIVGPHSLPGQPASPHDLVRHQISRLGTFESHVASFHSDASLIGNWTHFISNPVNGVLWNTATTGGHLLDDAKDYLGRMARGAVGAKWCPQNATDEYFRRVVASTHFVGGDSRCKHHDGGNAACDPGADRGNAACITAVDTLLNNAAAGPGTLACDDIIYYPRTITVPRFQVFPRVQVGTQQITVSRIAVSVNAVRQVGRAAFGALSGLERLLGHHCQQFNPNIACHGGGLAGNNEQTADPNYCECEILFPANNVNGKNELGGNGANRVYVDSNMAVVNEGTTTASVAQIQAGIAFYNGLCNRRPAQACNQVSDCDQYCGVPSSDPSLTVTENCVY